MEPPEGDPPAAYLPRPIDHSSEEDSPSPQLPAEDDGEDAAVFGAFDMGDSQLLGSPFPHPPAFEPAEPSYDDAAAEEALPLGVDAVALLEGSQIAPASAFEPAESSYDDAAGEETLPMSAEAVAHLEGSPIAHAPAVELAEPGYDDAAGEEVLPMSVEAAPPGSVKRKRGRPPKAHSAGGKAPAAKKKEEEEVCFICFDGGNLVVCDRRGCPKVYHPACINRDEAFFRPRSRWNCGWHICSICQKAATFMCCTCTYSLCKGCIKEARFFCVRGYKGFCETCYKTIMLIESNGQANEEQVRVDFDDKNSWEYLFKVYWLTLKGKLSLTLEELRNAKNPWKVSGTSVYNEETSDELYDANDDQEASSDSCSVHHEGNISSRKKVRRHSRKSADGERLAKGVDIAKKSLSEDSGWASPELLEFVAHMKDGDKSVLSQFDVQALLLEYIKRNNLRDPRRKSQIVCDARLQNLFGKARVGHFEMLKLLESHFLIKEAPQIGTDDNQGGTLDPDYGQVDAEEYNDVTTNIGSDKRRKTRKRVGERELQSNLDDYAAIDVHNINLFYMRRSLMEDLIGDANFSEKVVGSFVRIRISGAGQKQDMYRLVQVMGTHVVAEKYKVGKKTTDIALEILNLNKTEILSIDAISNQEFTEEECRRLRQSIKCGLISRLTVGDLLEKAKVLQEVRVNDWLESEKLRLSHLRDRASDLGRRKELRECVEKLQILNTPEERKRRVSEVPEIHVDPHMDPSYESPEEADDKKEDDFNRSREVPSRRKGKKLLSPGRGSISNNQWNGASKSLSSSWLPNRSTQAESAEARLALGDRTSEFSLNESNASWINSSETPKAHTHAIKPEAAWNDDQLVTKVEHPYGIAPETMISSSGVAVPSNGSENDKVWHYQDPSGKIQGPFSMLQLRKWSSTGYFPPDLRVWPTSQKPEESVLLTDVLSNLLNNTQLQESQITNFSQPTNFAAAEANTGHNWDLVREEKTNPRLVGIKQNESHWNVNQNDITISAAGYNLSNIDRWAPQTANYSEPKRVLITQEGRIGVSTRVWESSRDANAWYGQPPSYNSPSPRFSALFSGSACNSPAYQVIGGQAEHVERWSRNQDHGSSWNSVRSRPLRPSGQGYEERHSSWSPSSQQSHQVSTQYQRNQSATNSRNQWINDAYGPSTPTPQPSSMDWTSDQRHMSSAPSATVTAADQSVLHGWKATPNAVLHQLATGSVEPKGSTSLMTSAGGWGSMSSSDVPNKSAVSEIWDSGSAASISTTGTNQKFGKMNDLSDLSWTSQQTKPSESNATASSGTFMKKSQFFESSCPSPTPSSERDGSPPIQINGPDSGKKFNETSGTPVPESRVLVPDTTILASRPLDPNVSLSAEVDSMLSSVQPKDEVANEIAEIEKLASFSSETQNDNPSFAGIDNKLGDISSTTMPKPDALESDSVQKSDTLTGSELVSELNEAHHLPHGCGTNDVFLASRLDETQTKNPECFSGPEYVLKDTKSTGSLPSPTPASKPSEWNLAVDSTLGKSQSDVLISSDGFVPPLSPTISATSIEPAALRNPASSIAEGATNKGWVIAPETPSMDGPARGSENFGWGEQAKASMSSGAMAQGSASVAWGTAQGTATETGWIMPGQKNTNANTGWVTPTQGNRRTESGWVAQGNMNPNASWGVPMAPNSNFGWESTISESGWGTPATGITNQNLSWSPQHGSNNAGWGAPATGITNQNLSWSPQHGSNNTGWGTATGKNSSSSSATGYQDISASQKWHGGDRYHDGRESGHGGSHLRSRTYSGGVGGGGSSQAFRGHGQGQGQGQRGVCKFYESGHCKKGASCNYLHP